VVNVTCLKFHVPCIPNLIWDLKKDPDIRQDASKYEWIKRNCRVMTISVLFLMTGLNAAHACTNPAGAEGDLTYNTTHNVPMYCDGTNWIAMAGGAPSTGTIVTSGLVGYWKLDETSGTTAADSTGNNNLTYQNITPSAATRSGIIGSSILVNHATVNAARAITTSASPVLNGNRSFSVSGWIKPNIAPESVGLVGIVEIPGLALIQKSFNDSRLAFSTEAWTVNRGNYTSYGAITLDQWSHFVVTYSYDDAPSVLPRWYINGKAFPAQGSWNGAPAPTGPYVPQSSTEFIIGDRKGSSFSSWRGELDDIRVYNRVLSQSEAQSIYFEGLRPSQIVPSGLIGHWRLDETSGTTAFDSSGNGYNATMANGVSAASDSLAGMADSAISFDGFTSSNNINIPYASWQVMSGDFSLAAWVKFDPSKENGGTSYRIISSQYAGTIYYFLRISNSGSLRVPQFAAKGTLGSQMVNGTVNLNDGNWHYLVGTRSGTSHRLYVDGVQHGATATGASGAIDTGQSLFFGALTVASENFPGLIDDIRIYNRAITGAEIAELYAAHDGIRYNMNKRTMEYFDKSRFVAMTPPWPDVTRGLIQHYKLDETTGTVAADSAGSNNGTYTGFNPAIVSMPGAVGSSINFAQNSYGGSVEAPGGPLSATREFTLAGWILFEASNGFFAPILAEKCDMFLLRTPWSSRRVLFAAPAWSAHSGSWQTNNSIVPYQWNHVAVSYSYSDPIGTAPRIYINGVLETLATSASNTGTFVTPSAATQVWVGRRCDASSSAPPGRLDDIRVYDRILSATEIQMLYNMGAPVGPTALPLGCPNIGDVCDDGTIYAGLSPDGNVRMFAAPADEGNYSWGSLGSVRGTTSGSDGYGNTATLAAFGSSAHPAAYQCAIKQLGGADDWYLPAQDELQLINNGGSPLVPGIDLSGVRYLSSTEHDSNYGRARYMSSDSSSNIGKAGDIPIRCVRKGPAPRCANPYGLEGSLYYNTTNDVMQYCDGARWIAIGKVN